MTYLDICKTVRELSGAQGTGPASVEDGTLSGYEVNLVAFVDSCYIDIQSKRRDFKFMRANYIFNTIASESTYTLFPDDIKRFKSMRVQVDGKWRYIEEVDYDKAEAAYLNTDAEGAPQYFTRVPGTVKDIKLYPTPDVIYPMYYEYFRKPETLQDNDAVPMLPEEWHMLIVYDALERFAGFMVSLTMDEKYVKAAKLMRQQFLREEVPQKDIKVSRSFAI